MVTKPIGQVHPVDPAGGEIEHETLLVIDGGVDLSATEMYEKPGKRGGKMTFAVLETTYRNARGKTVLIDPALTEEAVIAHCRESRKLAAFKRPRIVRFAASLPSNPSGKIVLPELRRLAADPAAGRGGEEPR